MNKFFQPNPIWVLVMWLVACQSEPITEPTPTLNTPLQIVSPTPFIEPTATATAELPTEIPATSTPAEATTPPVEPTPTLEPSATPTTVLPTVAPVGFNPADYYYLLNERPPTILAIHRDTLQLYQEYPLDELDKVSPEGLTIVTNAQLAQTPLFGLPPAENGAYFLISSQAKGDIFVFDVPLAESDPRPVSPLLDITFSDLKKDASAVTFFGGQLWVTAASDETLFLLASELDKKEKGEVLEEYDLSDLAEKAPDTEGLAWLDSDSIVLADDLSAHLVRYDNFPACLEEKACTAGWIQAFNDLEPSGIAWDEEKRLLLVVDDEGVLFGLDEYGQGARNLFQIGYDLEDVAVWPR